MVRELQIIKQVKETGIEMARERVLDVKDRLVKFRKDILRFVVNDMPTRLINSGYNYYSMLYQGQLRFGLPVSKELLQSQHETKVRAATKLALTLYHMFYHATGTLISRNAIKFVILDELDKGRLRLTEHVIFLSKGELEYLAQARFQIPKRFIPEIIVEAGRRRILKESIKEHVLPAYFESEVEEREENGRGDYEIVFFRSYTDEGKEIGFRRLVSMEDVTAGDNNPSVTMIPGFANNSNCYNLNNRYSIAKDFADRGNWVYLFDPRGMGVNDGKFDPMYTVDALVDYDLPAVVKTICRRSKGKPTILMGHSMGGLGAENMVINWNLRRVWRDLAPIGNTVMSALDKVLPPIAEATQNLKMIRGVITLGSPKFFEKSSHLLFPTVLWLNHLSRIFKLKDVPFAEFFWALTQLPGLSDVMRHILNTNIGEWNIMICPENHKDDKYFAQRLIYHAMESVPLGMGFQFLKAIYNGEGFKRMDETRLNYSECYSYFPDNIPLFHFYGSCDPLASTDNMKYSKYYPHRVKKTFHIESVEDLKHVDITPDRSQMVDFVIEGANHFDLLYGKVAEEIVHPLLHMITEAIWDDWSYAYCGSTAFSENKADDSENSTDGSGICIDDSETTVADS